MTFEFIYTSIIIAAMTVALVREWFEADVIIFSALIMLLLGGVIDIQEAVAGFSNTGMLTIAFLFVVAGAVQKTGTLEPIGNLLLGKQGPLPSKLIRFLFPVSAVSAFFNNTPIVAMLIPVVRNWSKKQGVAVSRMLIPLSYAAILGGLCTLIGTSTNLVVHGLIIDNGMEGFAFFEISKIGVPVAVLGILAVSLLGFRFLPDRREPSVRLGQDTREFVVGMKVLDNYQHIGKTIEKANLRHLKGLFLFQIERQGSLIAPVGPGENIEKNDRLFFTGLPETIMELQKTPGLTVLRDSSVDLNHFDSDRLETFEAVVSRNSPLLGKSVRDSNFRGRYQAVIIAVHRSGERIRKKIGDVVLHSGDTLLILADRGFLERWYHSRDFYLVSRSTTLPSKPVWKVWFSMVVLAAMIAFMALNMLPVLTTVAAAAILLILSGCITPADARNSVEWNVLLIIASAFGLARALDNSGVAHFLAERLLTVVGGLGVVGILSGTYFITSFYTEIITNNAAAALVFPIALSLARQTGLDPRPFFLLVAIGASASFATPIGYQTNLMVYGPGGYKFKDFLKIGIPMNLFVGIVAITLIYLYFYR